MSKDNMLSMLYSILAELQENKQLEFDYYAIRSMNVIDTDCNKLKFLNAFVYKRLTSQLEILYQILDDDVPEEYFEQIEYYV